MYRKPKGCCKLYIRFPAVRYFKASDRSSCAHLISETRILNLKTLVRWRKICMYEKYKYQKFSNNVETRTNMMLGTAFDDIAKNRDEIALLVDLNSGRIAAQHLISSR